MPQTDISAIQPLFEDVQMSRIFPDGKTFVDCIPKKPVNEISHLYLTQKQKPGFNLKSFVRENFKQPVAPSQNYQSHIEAGVEKNIETLWAILTRQPDPESGTLIPLPFPYIVPGGRFGEIYYWDSYFTMLGLKEAGNISMIENMIRNFSYLIDKVGYIPNGNRTYFLGRSQPPFYSLMIRLLATIKEDDILLTYLPQLEKEYNFWMKGAASLTKNNKAVHRVVKMKGGEILNRYWDENESPRPESYREDVELSHRSKQQPAVLFRHVRAAAESGWDFSCRWFKDKDSFATIHTTEIVPVDLNCLLFHLEETIATAYQLQNNPEQYNKYHTHASGRKKAILDYCWNSEKGFFFDVDFENHTQKEIVSLAGVFPLFFRIASVEQAKNIARVIKDDFLSPGGIISSLNTTGQQWDAPNGWAPLHWVTILGLENYGFTDLANIIAKRWLHLNEAVFKRTGKLMEKYNVIDTHLEAGGGEYDGQDGFGWTNGVFLALKKKYG